MELRRSGRRDERRRRVLRDETVSTTADVVEASKQGTTGRRSTLRSSYGEDAGRERQPRVTDLFPTRPFWQLVIVLVVLALVTALVAAFGQVEQASTTQHRAELVALDFSQRGNLAHCLTSLLLGMCAAICVFIYRLRRHKVDDYRGRYRLWLWLAGMLAMASIDATAGYSRAVGWMLGNLADWRLISTSAGWVAILYMAVAKILLLRCIFELWHCRPATVALGLAAGCHLAGHAVAAEWILRDGGSFALLVSTLCSLLGCTALLAVGLLYGSYVLRDVQGLLPASAGRRSRRRPVKTASASATATSDSSVSNSNAKSDPESSPRSVAGRISAAASTAARPATGAAAVKTHATDEQEADHHLSKSERRRLRKEQRRQARAA